MSAISPETVERILKDQAGLNAAERAMMLEDTRRILAKEDAVADAVHRRAFGDDYKPPGEDEMGDIHVGDTIIHQAPTSPPTVVGTPAQASSGTSPLAMAAIAGTAAAGLGAGVGIPLALMSQRTIENPPAIVQPIDADQLEYDLKIFRPEANP